MAAPRETPGGTRLPSKMPANACSVEPCDCSKYPELFLQNITTVLTQIEGETLWASNKSTNPTHMWAVIDNVLDALNQDITKLSISYASSPKPKCSIAEKLFENPTKCLLALVSSLYSLHNSNSGSLVVRQWDAAIKRVLSSLKQYAIIVLSGNADSLPQATGHVWELCTHAQTLPHTNHECLLINLTEISALIDDAFNELQEAHQVLTSESEPDDMLEEIPSEFDKSVLTAGLGLVKTAKILFSKMVKSVKSNGNSDTTSQIEDSDRISKVVLRSSEIVDDFAASLYSPVSREEIIENLPLLADHLTNVVETFKSTHMCGEASWTLTITNAIDHNRAKVEALIT